MQCPLCADFSAPSLQLLFHHIGHKFMQTVRDLSLLVWILKLKEKRKLIQSTLDEILQDVTELCTDFVAELGKHVASTLLSAGVKAEEVPGLLELFDEKSECCQPFHHLNTYHR